MGNTPQVANQPECVNYYWPMEALKQRTVKATSRVEIIEEEGGWWQSQIWDAKGVMVYQSHSRDEQAARRQAEQVFATLAGASTKPHVTIKYLGSN
jgi:hypothetical protein